MKGQMLKLFVVLAVCLSTVVGCMAPPPPTPIPVPPTSTPVPPTPAPDPLAIAIAYQDAIARHDVDAALALLTDDATYGWGDYFTSSDKTLIRNWLEYAAALNMQTTVNDCKLTDPTVTCDWRYVEECGRIGATGNFGVDATVIFTVKEGKISRIVVAPNPDPEYYKWTQAFLKWLEDTNPAEARSFTQALDTLKFGREFGERLSELCKEHAESLKATPVAAADPLNVVNALEDALNRYDVEAYVALFADQFDANVLGDQVTNKADLRYWPIDYGQGLGSKTRFSDCKVKENTITCKGTIQNDCSTNELPIVVTLKDGKIQKMDWPLLPDVESANHESLAAMGDWATKQGVAEWSTFDGLTKMGVWSHEAGAALLAVCRKYKAAASTTPAPSSSAPTSDLLAIIKAYQDAVNQHDVDAVTALFADRAIYRMSAGAVGRDEIREVEDWQAGLNDRLEFTDCKAEGNTVTCKGFLTDDCEKAVGGLGVRLDEVTFKVDDGKIQNVYGSASGVDSTRSDENGGLLIAWAQSNRPEDYAKYINPTKAGHTARQNGQLFLQMCLQAAKDPLFLVELWGAAFNRDDLDGVMGLFVDNGLSFTMGEISGDKQVARDTLEYIKGFNGKFDITDCKAKGQQVVCALALVDDYCVKAEGLKAVNYQATFKFKDNRIQTLDAKMAAADGSAVSAFGDKLGVWATANRPEDWKKYQDPAAAGITPRQNGELVATLCKDYLDSQK
jgi:hypothetical protein